MNKLLRFSMFWIDLFYLLVFAGILVFGSCEKTSADPILGLWKPTDNRIELGYGFYTDFSMCRYIDKCGPSEQTFCDYRYEKSEDTVRIFQGDQMLNIWRVNFPAENRMLVVESYEGVDLIKLFYRDYYGK